jgi:hypothetical protein
MMFPGRTDFLRHSLLPIHPIVIRDIPQTANALLFTSMRGGDGAKIWVCDSDGSNPVQLTHFAVDTGSPRWSPDGRYIAFDSDEAGQGDIYIIPAEGGPARRFTPDDSHEDLSSWSRDGLWIYFESNRTGQFQLWKAPFPSGRPVQVTQDWGKDALESPDGKFVYYAKEDHPGIWRKPVWGWARTIDSRSRRTFFLGHVQSRALSAQPRVSSAASRMPRFYKPHYPRSSLCRMTNESGEPVQASLFRLTDSGFCTHTWRARTTPSCRWTTSLTRFGSVISCIS